MLQDRGVVLKDWASTYLANPGRVRESTEKYGNLSFRLGETDVLVRTSTEEYGTVF